MTAISGPKMALTFHASQQKRERHASDLTIHSQTLRPFNIPIAEGMVGIGPPIDQFVCKIKMSRDKDADTQRRVMAALRKPGSFHNPELADDMARALSGDGPGLTATRIVTRPMRDPSSECR